MNYVINKLLTLLTVPLIVWHAIIAEIFTFLVLVFGSFGSSNYFKIPELMEGLNEKPVIAMSSGFYH
jgi:hypothetical protein